MSGFGPPILKSSIRSWNWPWMSPQTVTGHFYRGGVSWPAASPSPSPSDRRHVPLAARWTRPATPRAPVASLISTVGAQSPPPPTRATPRGGAHLVAEPLHVGLGQLLAVHQALNPAVERRDRGGLALHGRHLGRRPADVLHVGVHASAVRPSTRCGRGGQQYGMPSRFRAGADAAASTERRARRARRLGGPGGAKSLGVGVLPSCSAVVAERGMMMLRGRVAMQLLPRSGMPCPLASRAGTCCTPPAAVYL